MTKKNFMHYGKILFLIGLVLDLVSLIVFQTQPPYIYSNDLTPLRMIFQFVMAGGLAIGATGLIMYFSERGKK